MKRINSIRLRNFLTLTLVTLLLGLVLAACGGETTSSTVISLPTSGAATTNAATTAASVATTAAPQTTAVATATTAAPRTTSAPQTTAATATTSAARTTTPAATTAAPAPTSAPASTTSASASGTTSASAPPNVPTIAVGSNVTSEVDRIEQQTEKARNLKFLKDVQSYFMTRDDLAKYQEDQFRKDNPQTEIDRYNKILRAFAFVQPGFDLARVYIDLLNEQVLGFYDPDTKKLYMVVEDQKNVLTPTVKFTIEHELTHALQDQHFDLQKLRPIRKPGVLEWNDDKDYALTALIEGDAVTSQTVWLQGGNLSQSELQQLIQEQSAGGTSSLDKSPLILKETLFFPYLEGLNFVTRLYRNGGWAAVDKAFREYIPQSTAQILHPEKYLNKVEPVQVQIPNLVQALGNGYKSLETNTQGELQTRIWLEEGIGNTNQAKDAANGWAGDRYQVVESANGALGYIWRTAWDNAGESDVFFKTAQTAMTKLYNLSSPTGPNEKVSWTTATHDFSLVRKDKEVVVLMLPKGAGNDKILAQIGF